MQITNYRNRIRPYVANFIIVASIVAEIVIVVGGF